MDILLNAPKEINVSIGDFKNLTYYGIGAFFINWKYCIEKTDQGITVWTGDSSILDKFLKNPLFKDVGFFTNESAEVYYFVIPHGKIADRFLKFCHLKVLK